jgi:hypothetical protein
MSSPCDALEYGDCYGISQESEVIFKYRDSSGHVVPDEIVKTTLCSNHHNWLTDRHEGKPLEMRGEVAEYALHDDLFMAFADKNKMFTLIKEENIVNNVRNEIFYLINGRDVKTFRDLLNAKDKSKKNNWICEVGFFQTCIKTSSEDEDLNVFVDAITEVTYIHGELALAALSTDLVSFYKPEEEGEYKSIFQGAKTWFPRIEKNPTLETEYSLEPIPEFIRAHFIKKQEAEKIGNFEECCEFISGEIDRAIIDWNNIRDNSPHTDNELFESFNILTAALLNEDKCARNAIITDMMNGGKMSPDVLWLTYVYANHELFRSHDPKKNLYNSTELIDLFVHYGLEKDLLALSIAGERMRMLSRSQRDHHDILETNEFVVEYLVPTHIKGSDIIYKTDKVELTPTEYWRYYDNTTFYIGGGHFNSGNEFFEKNPIIYDYLLKHMQAQATPVQATPAYEKTSVAEPEFGCLDTSLLKGTALEYYKTFVIENGNSESEFLMKRFPSLFEKLYTNMVDGTKLPMSFTESVHPGITKMYEQKKRDLQKNDYKAWKFMNDKLRISLLKTF